MIADQLLSIHLISVIICKAELMQEGHRARLQCVYIRTVVEGVEYRLTSLEGIAEFI